MATPLPITNSNPHPPCFHTAIAIAIILRIFLQILLTPLLLTHKPRNSMRTMNTCTSHAIPNGL
ncbi:hypothetical protein EX30DRAFT_343415 [Ascodesmis nigricans]|uniref:Uncharacterized protein n=1 Tax=Ascodesmis nigricans TaxID=341454 RepID=A0A4S2MRY5_9PEZI|nr:hypothetical protein EX30DRAFT_343415 [Ascodesmis nigricans]